MTNNLKALLTALVTITLLGCSGGPGSTEPECPVGMVKAAKTVGEVCTYPIDTQTNTDTGTVTTTDTGTQTDTGTVTSTDTTTATSTFTYTDACDYAQDRTVTGGKAIARIGEWTVTGCSEAWMLCITQEYNTDNRVVGYAFLKRELDTTNPTKIPASLVSYEGVMANKCVVLNPVITSSTGPVVEGNTVLGSGNNLTITNGIITATWTQTGACIYRRPGT